MLRRVGAGTRRQLSSFVEPKVGFRLLPKPELTEPGPYRHTRTPIPWTSIAQSPGPEPPASTTPCGIPGSRQPQWREPLELWTRISRARATWMPSLAQSRFLDALLPILGVTSLTQTQAFLRVTQLLAEGEFGELVPLMDPQVGCLSTSPPCAYTIRLVQLLKEVETAWPSVPGNIIRLFRFSAAGKSTSFH